MLDYILSADFVLAIMRMATPIIFVGMAAVIGGKANVLCIAYEGMMLFAALGGVIGSAYTQNIYIGVLVGIFAGVIVAMIFAYFVLYLNAKPLLAGLALNMLGLGGTTYCIYLLTGMKLDTSSLASLRFATVEIPIIKDIPVLGTIVSGHYSLTYLAIVCVLLVYLLVFKTKLGLRIRAVGEDEVAAASVGINVRKVKFIALMLSGVLASLGGIFMSMAYLSFFSYNMTAGRGFIAIAAQNLGKGSPLFTFLYAIVFGGAMAFANIAQSYGFPSQFASALPYIITIIGLTIIGAQTGKKNKKKRRNHESVSK